MSRLPTLEYPLTRSFPGRLFSPIVFGGAVVVLVFLATINAVLAGYETVTVFNSDFSVVQRQWFDRYLPSRVPKPGSMCDPRLLNLGDNIATNYSLFQYSITSVDTANAGDSSLSYKGWTLDNCDITSLYVNANANTFVIDFTALISCRSDASQVAAGNNFEISARTDWPMSTLAGQYASLLGAQKAMKQHMAGIFDAHSDPRGSVLDAVNSVASGDFASRVLSLDQLTNGSFPTIISFQADFPWCPASMGRDAACAQQIPPLKISGMFTYAPGPIIKGFADSKPITDDNQPLLTNDTTGIISNLVQSTYALVRLDLGNPSPNNFLLNTSVLPDAILATFPQTFPTLPEPALFPLLSTGVGDGWLYNITGALPLAFAGPAVLDGVYLCRFQEPKSPGSAFIAVLVATLSMFSSGWALFMTLSATIVKRRGPAANTCAAQVAMPHDYSQESFPLSHSREDGKRSS
ncbi:hypothetical protein C8R43DRAFT_6256 [Mycena crocata]|nr:hypothetical protein C8R43DRAFT_6256 [Mycena crocata]